MGNPPFEEVSPIENGGFPLQKVSLPGGSYIYTKLTGGNSHIFLEFYPWKLGKIRTHFDLRIFFKMGGEKNHQPGLFQENGALVIRTWILWVSIFTLKTQGICPVENPPRNVRLWCLHWSIVTMDVLKLGVFRRFFRVGKGDEILSIYIGIRGLEQTMK